MFRLTWRALRWGIAAIAAVAGLLYVSAIWDASNDLRTGLLDPISVESVEYDVEVVARTGPGLTLARTGASQADGIYGISWDGGYGRVGLVRDITATTVARDFAAFEGDLAVGAFVRFDEYAYPEDPVAAHGIAPTDVVIAGPNGDYPAWYFPGGSDRWVIFVHGRGTVDRAQVHRVLPVLTDLDLPVLAVTYRNDANAPPDPDGRVHWGLREWSELEAAAKYALASGAEDYIVIGYGMGASMAAIFARQSPLATKAAAWIFDSPVLDLSAVADEDAANRGVPELVAEPAKAIASFRFDIKWSDLDQANHAGRFRTPILLFHGTADAVAPVETADEFAASRPDIVTYHRVTGAGHMAVWNWDPTGYELAVEEFMAGLDGDEPA